MLQRAVKLSLIVALACPVSAGAQQVGDNVNVLPVYKTVAFNEATGKWEWHDDGLDYLRGNLYGQRLNEPAILVSSRNKDHLLIFFNDYRAVDVRVDQAIPSTQRNSLLASLWNGLRSFFARLAGRPASKGQPGEADHAAFSQAGVGCSVSYDGGLTWTGCMVPGMPLDLTPASVHSPSYARGLQGMSDPAVAPGRCGKGYLANIAYTYNQGSELQVHTVQDMNDSDVLPTWEWKHIAAVADCNNAAWGCFVDKPAITTFMLPSASCSDTTERVYTTFTTFTGTTGTDKTKFQSKVNLATSIDGGQSFSTQLVDGNYTEVQGTDVKVSQVATPTDPAGTVFVFFRSFRTPNSIIMRRSITRSSGWDKPVDIIATGDPAHPTLETFDQPTIDLATGGPDGLTFRANAFPAAAITPDGKLLIVTFQEKADPVTGIPSATGSPRIMMTYSTDGGRTWSPRHAISYMGNRAEAVGLGFFSPVAVAPGPQAQPAVVCSTNTACLVTWMESRDPLSSNGWMSGFYRRMNHRAMAIQIQGGVPALGPSVQVSRYSYDDEKTVATDAEGEVEQIRINGVPMFPMWNHFNFNNYDTGRSPFDGDYTDIRALTENTFITAFTDNRYVVPATQGPGGTGAPWLNFANYGPWPQCQNSGSRAQTVMAAQISNGLVVTTPTNHKGFTAAPVACGATLVNGVWSQPTQQCIEFPFTVWNNTGFDKRYKIWLTPSGPALPPTPTDPQANASFAKDIGTRSEYTYPLKVGGLNIYQYSSNSANVYAFDGNPVTVNIAECPNATCTGFAPTTIDASVTFNSNVSAPPSGSQGTYAYVPSAISVQGRNVQGRNVQGRNVQGRNVQGRNVQGRNMLPPGVTVYNVIDYSIVVTPNSDDDVGSYLSLFNVDRAYTKDYIFQMLVTKPLTSFTTEGDLCEPYNLLDGAQVGHTSGLTVGGSSVQGRNVQGRNPVPIDGDLDAQTLQNTSFTMGSSTGDYLPSGGGTGAQTNFGCPGGWGRIGECTLAAPRLPNTVIVTLRAYQTTPTAELTRVYNPEVAPPAMAVAEYACKGDPSCFTESGPDLAVPEGASVSPVDVAAGSLVTFPTSDVTVENIGKDCADGQPCGTAQKNRWGIYLSTASTAESLPRYEADDTCPYADLTQCVPGMIKENLTDSTKPITTLLAFGDGRPATDDLPSLVANLAKDSNGNPITCGTLGSCAAVTPQNVRIPADILRLNNDRTTTFYAWLYIDDERVVSELNEDNNLVRGGPITIRPGAYGTSGLLSPCGPDLTCSRTGLGAVPLAWQFAQGGVAVDTQTLRPTLTFYYSNSAWQQGSQIGSAVTPCAAGTTCDLSTGNSGFQYCNAAGTYPLCNTRLPFTWQYNWERKDPVGRDLTGNIILWIAPTATQTCQNGAACEPGTAAIGPIRITLR